MGFFLSGEMEPKDTSAAPASVDRVRIEWNADEEPWSGLTLLNVGQGPIDVRRVILNGRDDCTLRFVDPSAVKTSAGSIERLELVANILFSTGALGFFSDADGASAKSGGTDVTMRVGDRAILIRPARCGAVVRASVVTSRGTFEIPFDRPYSGQR